LGFLALSSNAFSSQYLSAPDDNVEVEVSIYLADIFNINDSTKSAHVKFYLTAEWFDKRLKGKYKESSTLPVSEIWHPRIEILTRKSLVADTQNKVEITPDGKVIYLLRYIGDISFIADYRNFPFDTQKIDLEIVAARKKITLKIREIGSLRAENFSIDGWEFGEGTYGKKDIAIGNAKQMIFKGLSLEIIGKRLSKFYLWKVFYPLSIILLLAGAVFGIPPSQAPARISVPMLATLALVAYDFVIAGMVPKLSYTTSIDIFYNCSLALVFMAFSCAIITNKIAETKMELALRISLFTGIAYILSVIILLIVIIE